MKKVYCLCVFLFCAVCSNALGPFYTGINQLGKLLDAVVDEKGNEFQNPGSGDSNGGGNLLWENTKLGFIWERGYYIDYQYSDNYIALTGINWKNRAFTQKKNVPIEIIHIDINPLSESSDHNNFQQDNELRKLETIDFSGNFLRDITIDGNNLMVVSLIDISNNPTLELLSITNCPALEMVDITNCELPLSKIYAITQSVEPANVLVYAPQKTIHAAFCPDNVDLSPEYIIDGTVSVISWLNEVEPLEENNGIYKFDKSLSGQTIYCKITNEKLPGLTDGVTYAIALTSGSGISTNTTAVDVWTKNNTLYVSSNKNEWLSIYAIDGRLVKQRQVSGLTEIPLKSGLYIVRFSDGRTRKVKVD